MRLTPRDFVHVGRDALNARPVLTVIMVYSVGIGAAALMALLAAWAAPVQCPQARTAGHTYLVQRLYQAAIAGTA